MDAYKDQLARIETALERIEGRLTAHGEWCHREAHETVPQREAHAGEHARLSSALQTRTFAGAVGVLLAALCQPLLSHFGVKVP